MKPQENSNPKLPSDRYRRQLDKALAKAELIRLYRAASFGSANTLDAKNAFIAEYNRPGGRYSKFYAVIGPASFQSLERWSLKLERSHGRPACLIDSRGMHRGLNRKATKRTVVRLLGIITKVPVRSREKWFQFLEGIKAGQSPEEISASVGVHVSTVRNWIKAVRI
ncbi:MAG: hypothetical protein WAN11_17475 [Syntrophobacteraceae bacterium]